MYQASVAGKPRLDGARAALAALGVPDVEGRAGEYASRKQSRLEGLIAGGQVAPRATTAWAAPYPIGREAEAPKMASGNA